MSQTDAVEKYFQRTVFQIAEDGFIHVIMYNNLLNCCKQRLHKMKGLWYNKNSSKEGEKHGGFPLSTR